MKYGVWMLTAGLWLGCGGAPPPQGQLTSAQAAIRSADEVGAQDSPRAALHLKYARDQYALAQRLVEEKENERAAIVLKRAEADAELALALAREVAAEKQAKDMADEVRAMREQIERAERKAAAQSAAQSAQQKEATQ